MAATAGPYGFKPIGDQAGIQRTLRMPLGIASGYGANIFKYQPCKLVSGLIQAVTATSDQIFGIFAGVEFTPSGGRPAVSPFWPTGQTYDANFDMMVYVWPAWMPGMRLQVQADGPVAQALMGSGFNIASVTGSTVTGLSAASVLHAGVAASSQAQFALEEFYPGDASSPNDAFTDLIVSVAYPQIISGYQVSIG